MILFFSLVCLVILVFDLFSLPGLRRVPAPRRQRGFDHSFWPVH
jgi:hypothetical protein